MTNLLRVHCLQLRIAMELIVPFTDPKEFVKETDRELLSSRIVHCFKQGGMRLKIDYNLNMFLNWISTYYYGV